MPITPEQQAELGQLDKQARDAEKVILEKEKEKLQSLQKDYETFSQLFENLIDKMVDFGLNSGNRYLNLIEFREKHKFPFRLDLHFSYLNQLDERINKLIQSNPAASAPQVLNLRKMVGQYLKELSQKLEQQRVMLSLQEQYEWLTYSLTSEPTSQEIIKRLINLHTEHLDVFNSDKDKQYYQKLLMIYKQLSQQPAAPLEDKNSLVDQKQTPSRKRKRDEDKAESESESEGRFFTLDETTTNLLNLWRLLLSTLNTQIDPRVLSHLNDVLTTYILHGDDSTLNMNFFITLGFIKLMETHFSNCPDLQQIYPNGLAIAVNRYLSNSSSSQSSASSPSAVFSSSLSSSSSSSQSSPASPSALFSSSSSNSSSSSSSSSQSSSVSPSALFSSSLLSSSSSSSSSSQSSSSSPSSLVSRSLFSASSSSQSSSSSSSSLSTASLSSRM